MISSEETKDIPKKLTFEQVGVAPWLVKNLGGVGIAEPT